MPDRIESNSRKLLKRLRDPLAEKGAGQERLDRITRLISASMGTHVCSIYLFRDDDTLELCATQGLKAASAHQTRLKLGEGLVGRVAKTATPINTGNAPDLFTRKSPADQGRIHSRAFTQRRHLAHPVGAAGQHDAAKAETGDAGPRYTPLRQWQWQSRHTLRRDGQSWAHSLSQVVQKIGSPLPPDSVLPA